MTACSNDTAFAGLDLNAPLGDEVDSTAFEPHRAQASDLLSITLPPCALTAISILEAGGYEAWCVGGFVRDSLLGRAPGDIDIATNAHWTEVKNLFGKAGLSSHETGVKHGTLTVIVEDAAIEITTYRKDERYLDGRHPESVIFVSSIEEDLARRDFTVNALAYNPSRGIVDVFNGLSDLRDETIRCVGDPQKRFKEDALRILRGCRFRSQLGFRIEEKTFAAMLSNKCLLRRISTERIASEIEDLLMGDHVHDALMETVDVISFVLPELVAMKGFDQKTPYHIYDVLEHTAWVVQHTPHQKTLRWAALFHDMGKPGAAFEGEDGVRHFYGHAAISQELARGIMSRLLMGPSMRDRIISLVKHHDELIEPTPRGVKRMLHRLGGNVELFEMLCDLKIADALSQAPFCHERASGAEKLKRVLAEVLNANEAFSLKHLAINGNDLVELGLEPGPAIGQILKEVLNAVIEERVKNEKEQLLDFARNIMGSETAPQPSDTTP